MKEMSFSAPNVRVLPVCTEFDSIVACLHVMLVAAEWPTETDESHNVKGGHGFLTCSYTCHCGHRLVSWDSGQESQQ